MIPCMSGKLQNSSADRKKRNFPNKENPDCSLTAYRHLASLSRGSEDAAFFDLSRRLAGAVQAIETLKKRYGITYWMSFPRMIELTSERDKKI